MASSLYNLVLLLMIISRLSEAALHTYNFTLHSGTRAPGNAHSIRCSSIDLFGVWEGPLLTFVDGFPREVYLINGQQPGPLIEINEGDDLEVVVKNDLSVESTIHWHGRQPNVVSS